MANVVTRIKEFIDFKGIAISAFEKSVGMSNASFGKNLKNGGAIGSDKLERILSVYPEISAKWLLTGDGEMIEKTLETTNHNQDELINVLLNKLTEQAEQIGTLKEQINQLQSEKGKDVSAATGSSGVVVG